jgi:hypothetical protein
MFCNISHIFSHVFSLFRRASECLQQKISYLIPTRLSTQVHSVSQPILNSSTNTFTQPQIRLEERAHVINPPTPIK